tara:strand:- start:253 stop:978 length:726 start_codon:yes stop_codon:yes gene_type:complete
MSSLMSYSELQPYEITAPPLSSMFKNDTNPHIQDLFSIKETILEIINGNEEITFSEEDYKNTDIDKLIQQVQELKPQFDTLQDELSDIDKKYKQEIKEIQKKTSTIDSMMTFIKQISYSNIDEKDLQEIVDKMKSISEGIIKNETITKLREEYIQKRKELHPHLHFIRQLNQWNVANMCPICFKEKVSHYLNPCGHTGCKECLEKNRRETVTNNFMPQSDLIFECAFCRSQITSIKPLFFL